MVHESPDNVRATSVSGKTADMAQRHPVVVVRQTVSPIGTQREVKEIRAYQ